MTARKGGGEDRTRRGVRWGALMFGAFLAGLLAVGGALLLPGKDREAATPAASSPFSPPRSDETLPPPAAEKPSPRLAIVVDDLGYEPTRDAEWLNVPVKVTLAVIPFGPSSRRIAEAASSRGFGVLIHVPMEPETPASDRTEGFRMHRGMAPGEMASLLARMLEEIPWASGASNHMGSAFTADPEAMASYAALLGTKGLFLLDSATTPRSVALEAARAAGVPAARRDVFLDAAMRPDEMRRQWDRAVALAREKGTAILVCHGRAETLRVILDLLPGLGAQGVQTVTVDELIAGRKG